MVLAFYPLSCPPRQQPRPVSRPPERQPKACILLYPPPPPKHTHTHTKESNGFAFIYTHLLFGLTGHFGLLKDVNISFFLSLFIFSPWNLVYFLYFVYQILKLLLCAIYSPKVSPTLSVLERFLNNEPDFCSLHLQLVIFLDIKGLHHTWRLHT